MFGTSLENVPGVMFDSSTVSCVNAYNACLLCLTRNSYDLVHLVDQQRATTCDNIVHSAQTFYTWSNLRAQMVGKDAAGTPEVRKFSAA